MPRFALGVTLISGIMKVINPVTQAPPLYSDPGDFRSDGFLGKCCSNALYSRPPIEGVAKFKGSAELAKIANDEKAGLVNNRHPQGFLSTVGSLPMNDIDATLKELDRVPAISE